MIKGIGASKYKTRAHFQYKVATTVTGGTYTAGAWAERPINTEVFNDINGCSLSSNAVTVPSGVYYILVRAAMKSCGNAVLRIYDETADASVTHATCGFNSYAQLYRLEAKVTFDVTTAFRIDMRADYSKADTGMGEPCSLGDDEIYLDLFVQKLY